MQNKIHTLLYQNEQQALVTLWHTGIMIAKNLNIFFHISQKRQKKLIEMHYLEEEAGTVILGQNGTRFCHNIGMRFPYAFRPQNRSHDLRLNEQYLQLPAEIRATWLTESALRNFAEQQPAFPDFYKQIEMQYGRFHATPDGAFYSPKVQGYVAIEVTTKNYKTTDIAQKRAFASAFLSGIYFT